MTDRPDATELALAIHEALGQEGIDLAANESSPHDPLGDSGEWIWRAVQRALGENVPPVPSEPEPLSRTQELAERARKHGLFREGSTAEAWASDLAWLMEQGRMVSLDDHGWVEGGYEAAAVRVDELKARIAELERLAQGQQLNADKLLEQIAQLEADLTDVCQKLASAEAMRDNYEDELAEARAAANLRPLDQKQARMIAQRHAPLVAHLIAADMVAEFGAPESGRRPLDVEDLYAWHYKHSDADGSGYETIFESFERLVAEFGAPPPAEPEAQALIRELTEIITANDMVAIEEWPDEFEGNAATLLLAIPESISARMVEHLRANGAQTIDGQWRGVKPPPAEPDWWDDWIASLREPIPKEEPEWEYATRATDGWLLIEPTHRRPVGGKVWEPIPQEPVIYTPFATEQIPQEEPDAE